MIDPRFCKFFVVLYSLCDILEVDPIFDVASPETVIEEKSF